jgi:hypothetical protein
MVDFTRICTESHKRIIHIMLNTVRLSRIACFSALVTTYRDYYQIPLHGGNSELSGIFIVPSLGSEQTASRATSHRPAGSRAFI